jgi:hypothetical protein
MYLPRKVTEMPEPASEYERSDPKILSDKDKLTVTLTVADWLELIEAANYKGDGSDAISDLLAKYGWS